MIRLLQIFLTAHQIKYNKHFSVLFTTVHELIFSTNIALDNAPGERTVVCILAAVESVLVEMLSMVLKPC